MFLELFEAINICPQTAFNFGGKLAEACKGVGDMSFFEFMGSDCVRFVGATAAAPFIEAAQDAVAGWGDSGDTGDSGSTGGGSSYVSNPATEVTLAELLGEEQITLQDVIGAQ